MKLKSILAVVIFCLILANLYFTNCLTGTGGEMIELTQEIHALEHENRQIAIKIAQKRSLVKLEEKILKAGFSEPEKIVTLEPNSQVAFNK